MKLGKAVSSHLDFFILAVTSVFCIPLFGLSSSIDPVLTCRFLLWSVMTCVLLVLFTVRLCRNPDIPDCAVMRNAIFPLFLGYLVFSAISLTHAVNVTEGIYEVLKIFVSLIYLFTATIILKKDRRYYSILVKAVLVMATILSLIAVWQYFQVAYHESGIDILYLISSTMAHKNLLSSALFLTLPFCLYALLVFRAFWKVAGIVAMTLAILNILLLQTRSAWLGLLLSTVATAIVLCIFAKKLNISRGVFLKGSTAVAVVLIAAVLVFGYLYLKSNRLDSLVERVQMIGSQTYSSNIERILMWKKSLEAAKDNLILGHGCGNWKIILPSYGLDNLAERSFKIVHFQRPHNDFIWVLFETGIPGLLFYVSLFAVTLFYIFKIITRGSDKNDKLLSMLMFFGIVGYIVIASFSFPKERIFHSVFLMLMTAIVVSIYAQSCTHGKNVVRVFVFALAVPSLCVLLFAVINGYVRLNGEIHTKRAFAARRAQNWPAVISEIDKGYSVFATLDPMSTPLKWYRGEANFLSNNVPQALEDYRKAYDAHPYHIHVLNNLATCYELQGEHDKAITYYNKALRIYPQFDDALINLGATYFNSTRYEESYETLLRCDPNTNDPRLKKYLKSVEKRLDKKKPSDTF